MEFNIVSEISNIETVAYGRGIKEIRNLVKLFGDVQWRKLKGIARVKLPSGNIREI